MRERIQTCHYSTQKHRGQQFHIITMLGIVDCPYCAYFHILKTDTEIVKQNIRDYIWFAITGYSLLQDVQNFRNT